MSAVTPFRHVTTQTITVSGTSAAVTNAFSAGIQVVRVTATTAIHYTVGVTPTATTSDPYLAAGEVEYVLVSEGEKVAAIQNASGGTAFVTECSK